MTRPNVSACACGKYWLRERVIATVAAACLSLGTAYSADGTSAEPSGAGELQEVVVSGEQPGPGLWRISKGDHVLWVLGTVPAFPKRMKWKTDSIEKILATSQVILSYPGATPDANIGFFSVMLLLPTLVGIEKLPDGGTLEKVLPAPLYARWVVQRQKYLGNSQRLEHLRPFIAADKLADTAYEKSGLTDDGEVIATVRKMAKKYRLKKVDAQYHFFVKDPKGMIKSFKRSSLDESACFSYELDVLDYSLAEAALQANAWATGDVPALKSSMEKKPQDPCWQGFSSSSFVKDLGVEDILASIDDAWLKAAGKSLADNLQSFALLEMPDVLLPSGLLARLAASGYTVQAPVEEQ